MARARWVTLTKALLDDAAHTVAGTVSLSQPVAESADDYAPLLLSTRETEQTNDPWPRPTYVATLLGIASTLGAAGEVGAIGHLQQDGRPRPSLEGHAASVT